MKNKFVDFKVLATSLCCSVVMGLISFAFLKCLDYAADFRSFFPLCYMFLPVAGIVTAFVYKRIGGKSSMGNNIIIESANDGEKVPKRLASLTFIFTCITHLFGGSVGREGTAVQIGGSLTSNVADYLGFKPKYNRSQRNQLCIRFGFRHTVCRCIFRNGSLLCRKIVGRCGNSVLCVFISCKFCYTASRL